MSSRAHFTPLEEFNNLRYLDWYHYLNCGYRLPAVAGTDKMGAYMPAGTNRVYAYLGHEEFNFPNWAKAVRGGNTFATSGPLLMFNADGHPPGEGRSRWGLAGGRLKSLLRRNVSCLSIAWRLSINGNVVASREEPAGARTIHLTEKVKVAGPGWFAARAASQLGPTTSWDFKIAAHTSPVYVRVPGKDLFSPEAATYFLQLIDGSQMYVETLATRPDPETFGQDSQNLHGCTRHAAPPVAPARDTSLSPCRAIGGPAYSRGITKGGPAVMSNQHLHFCRQDTHRVRPGGELSLRIDAGRRPDGEAGENRPV